MVAKERQYTPGRSYNSFSTIIASEKKILMVGEKLPEVSGERWLVKHAVGPILR